MNRSLALLLTLALAGCATAAGDYNPQTSSRIAQGLERLGASKSKRDCMAAGVDSRLGDAEDEEAARLVENARSRDEMQDGVLGASERVRRAFIGANLGCSLS
ncbi:MAG: hypothetical protein K2Q06_16235 [Parvularculaceae bacterium]|nr:hypothetical protein [Parvularculaceae bacterium]